MLCPIVHMYLVHYLMFPSHINRCLSHWFQISLVMPWKKAKKLIRDDPRYKNFTESDHVRLQLAARKLTLYNVCTIVIAPLCYGLYHVCICVHVRRCQSWLNSANH